MHKPYLCNNRTNVFRPHLLFKALNHRLPIETGHHHRYTTY